MNRIFQSISALYSEMKAQNFKGQISVDDGAVIVWRLDNNIIIKIYIDNHEGYIGTYYLKNNKEIELTHWHPMLDEIYDDLADINLGRTVWVKKRTLFGETRPIIMERAEYENMCDKKKSRYTII